MPTLHQDHPVHVLDLGDDENRFSPSWITGVNDLLDTVVRGSDAAALVTTGRGTFFSNGLDLAWLGEHGDRAPEYLRDTSSTCWPGRSPCRRRPSRRSSGTPARTVAPASHP